MSRCSIAPSAIQDLDDISDYFLERNIQAGEKTAPSIYQKMSESVNISDDR
jgi:hypothetical protein